jgi:hypothetical protein
VVGRHLVRTGRRLRSRPRRINPLLWPPGRHLKSGRPPQPICPVRAHAVAVAPEKDADAAVPEVRSSGLRAIVSCPGAWSLSGAGLHAVLSVTLTSFSTLGSNSKWPGTASSRLPATAPVFENTEAPLTASSASEPIALGPANHFESGEMGNCLLPPPSGAPAANTRERAAPRTRNHHVAAKPSFTGHEPA